MRWLPVLLLLLLSYPGFLRAEEAQCLTSEAVPQMPDNRLQGWLVRESPEEMKAHFESLVGDKKVRWDGDSLVVSCEVEGGTFETAVVTVEGGTEQIPGLAKIRGMSRDYFRGLARRTGHSDAEGEALYVKYSQLGYAPYLLDDMQQPVSAAEQVWQRHQQAAETPAGLSAEANAGVDRAAALKEKIMAAQQRGDVGEMMRLAAEMQQMVQPAVDEASRLTARSDEQFWQMLESMYPELARVQSYRSRIIPSNTAYCLPCSWPEE